MFDNPNFFLKNFRHGTELQISGSFTYNALYTLDNAKCPQEGTCIGMRSQNF